MLKELEMIGRIYIGIRFKRLDLDELNVLY